MLYEYQGVLSADESDELPRIESHRYRGGPVSTVTTAAIRASIARWLSQGTKRYLMLRPIGMDAVSLYNAVKGVVASRLAHQTEGWPALVAIKRGDRVYVTRRERRERTSSCRTPLISSGSSPARRSR